MAVKVCMCLFVHLLQAICLLAGGDKELKSNSSSAFLNLLSCFTWEKSLLLLLALSFVHENAYFVVGVHMDSALGHLNRKSYLRKKGLHLSRSAVQSNVALITEEALYSYLNGIQKCFATHSIIR